MSENSEKLFGLAGEFDNNISYPKSMETRRYISSTLILAGKEIESLEAENAALQQQVDALQQRVHLCAGYDALVAENAALMEAQRWIPVGERLPEEGLVMTAYTNLDGTPEVGELWFHPLEARIYWEHEHGDVETVTHWMPLPAPPTTDKGE